MSSRNVLAPDGKISIGSGRVQIPGFSRVDADASVDPDFVADAESLPFKEESLDTIYASHVLEHLSVAPTSGAANRWERIVGILQYWGRFLKPGGWLYVGVPDLRALFELLNHESKQISLQKTAVDSIFGGARSVFDLHYSGFTSELLRDLLGSAGFVSVEPFEPFVPDETQHQIMGRNISLNLRAQKPGEETGRSPSNHRLSPPAVDREEDELSKMRHVADERLLGMLNLEKTLQAQTKLLQDEIDMLRATCEERLQVINSLGREVQRQKSELEARSESIFRRIIKKVKKLR